MQDRLGVTIEVGRLVLVAERAPGAEPFVGWVLARPASGDLLVSVGWLATLSTVASDLEIERLAAAYYFAEVAAGFRAPQQSQDWSELKEPARDRRRAAARAMAEKLPHLVRYHEKLVSPAEVEVVEVESEHVPAARSWSERTTEPLPLPAPTKRARPKKAAPPSPKKKAPVKKAPAKARKGA